MRIDKLAVLPKRGGGSGRVAVPERVIDPVFGFVGGIVVGIPVRHIKGRLMRLSVVVKHGV